MKIFAAFVALITTVVSLLMDDADPVRKKKIRWGLFALAIAAFLTTWYIESEETDEKVKKEAADNSDKAKQKAEIDSLTRVTNLIKVVGEGNRSSINNVAVNIDTIVRIQNLLKTATSRSLITVKKIDSVNNITLNTQLASLKQSDLLLKNQTTLNDNYNSLNFNLMGGDSYLFTTVQINEHGNDTGEVRFRVSSNGNYTLKDIRVSIILVDDVIQRIKMLKPNELLSLKGIHIARNLSELNMGEINNESKSFIGEMPLAFRYCVFLKSTSKQWLQKIYIGRQKGLRRSSNYRYYSIAQKADSLKLNLLMHYNVVDEHTLGGSLKNKMESLKYDRFAQWETEFPSWDGENIYFKGKSYKANVN